MRGQNRATLGAVALVLATFVAFVAGSAFSDSSEEPGASRAPRVSSPTTVPASKITASSTTDQTVGMPKSALDPTNIPLGTDKSTTTPKRGYLYRCGGTPHGGPPVTIPPWVDTSAKTWDATSKLASGGKVSRTATFKATQSGAKQLLQGNGLPARSGTFPVPASDPTHAYNPNPGSVTAHSISLSLPYNPKVNTTPRCEAGAVGIAVNGIPLLDGFDAGGYDAAAVEVQDTCHGHPNDLFGYHYHGLSPCWLSTTAKTHATQVGWALDGFGVFVEYDSRGRLLTNASLDVCHGRTSVVPWHGKNVKIYHYVMTHEFPYTVGCYRGTPKSFAGMTISTRF
jgi:YHYH protein